MYLTIKWYIYVRGTEDIECAPLRSMVWGLGFVEMQSYDTLHGYIQMHRKQILLNPMS